MTLPELSGVSGQEKRCTRCGEYWPADEEFFRLDHRGDHPRLHAWCRTCEAEQKAASRHRAEEATT